MTPQAMFEPCLKACLKSADQTYLYPQGMSDIGKPDMPWT